MAPFVLDNSPEVSQLSKTLPPCATYLTPGDNLGYIGAPRWAYSQVRNQNWQWLIVSNCDLDFADNFYSELLRVQDGDVAMVAPSIRAEPSGEDQNPNMRFRPSKNKMRFWVAIKSVVPLAQAHHVLGLVKAHVRKKPDSNIPKPREHIYAPHGSVLIFHRRYFERGGDLNHVGFIFGEELYFAERVRELKLKVLFEPKLKVVHREHAVTGFWPRPLMIRYSHQSMKNLYDQYFA